VDLLINSVTPLVWAGDQGTDWDISLTANWRLGASSVTYGEASGIGPTVRFDDSAPGTTSVNLPVTVSPASVTISNNSLAYSINGSGRISGTTGLTKQGSGTLTLNTANNYAGNTVIQSGKLLLVSSELLPDGSGKGDVVVGGSLDLAGAIETINGLSGSGTIDNSTGGNATLIVGSNGVSSAFSGIVGGTAGTIALSKIGAGALTLSGNNTYSGGTVINVGQIRLGHNNALGAGTLTASGGAVSSDGTTPRSIANAVLITAACTFGDPTNNGLLTLSGPIDFNAAARNVTAASDLVWSGFSGNGRPNKFGSATLTITGSASWNGDAEVRNGTLILSGATVTNTGALRADSDQGFGSARMVITNGAYLELQGATANLRAGYDGDITATNYLDVAGTVRLPLADAGDGHLVAGRNGVPGIVTFYPGADVAVSAVNSVSAHGEIHFKGGTLRATVDNSNFMSGIDLVDIGSGGLAIDSAGRQIVITQPLVAGVGSGGIEKIGSGTLVLNGINTYAGTTLVSDGVLAGNGVISGPVNVGASGTLSPGAPFGALTVNNTVTLAGTTLAQISKTGATLTNGLLVASTLNCGSLLVVTNVGPDPLAAGDTFNLFDATTFNGTFSSFLLPVVPGLTWDTSKVALDGTIALVAAPQFTGFSVSGSTLTLSGTGGKPNGNYYLLASTNVAAPVTNWVPLQTNVFDGSGNFSTTVTVNPATPKQFFRLLVP
jgi:autotransporter-associated beta strand protein